MDEHSTVGSGQLVFIVGPSGAGKDSILRLAKEKIPKNTNIVFALRYVTRQTEHENEEIEISHSEFNLLLKSQFFCMHWQAHDLSYGISKRIETLLKYNKTVIVNGSRQYIPTALQRFPFMKIVLIQVPAAIAKSRLEQRGREDQKHIMLRMQRDSKIEAPEELIYTIDNSGPIEEATSKLMDYLIGLQA